MVCVSQVAVRLGFVPEDWRERLEEELLALGPTMEASTLQEGQKLRSRSHSRNPRVGHTLECTDEQTVQAAAVLLLHCPSCFLVHTHFPIHSASSTLIG